MNGRVIDHPDDLVVGKYVTVVGWVEDRTTPVTRGEDGEYVVGRKPKKRRDMFGDVLRVVAVSLPYLLVRQRDGALANLDLRIALLAPLDARFVRAAMRKEKKPKRVLKDKKIVDKSAAKQSKADTSLADLYEHMVRGFRYPSVEVEDDE